jgi:hypothetical protein
MDDLDNDSLDELADILSELNPVQRKKLEMLLHAKTRGIKKTRIVDKLSSETVGRDGNLSEYEEDTSIDDDGGIIHKKTSKFKLFDCGHPASKENFGHIAECGHTVCRDCVEKLDLVCAYPGCHKKLCSRPKCYSRIVRGRYYCVPHGREFFIYALFGLK